MSLIIAKREYCVVFSKVVLMTSLGQQKKKACKEVKSLLSFDGCVTQMGVVKVADVCAGWTRYTCRWNFVAKDVTMLSITGSSETLILNVCES
jgi:hypothetical protein